MNVTEDLRKLDITCQLGAKACINQSNFLCEKLNMFLCSVLLGQTCPPYCKLKFYKFITYDIAIVCVIILIFR